MVGLSRLLHVELRGVPKERAVGSWGPGASWFWGLPSWRWPHIGAWWNGGLSVKETCNHVVLVCFIQGFLHPMLEVDIVINGVFGCLAKSKEEAEILHNVVLLLRRGHPTWRQILLQHAVNIC